MRSVNPVLLLSFCLLALTAGCARKEQDEASRVHAATTPAQTFCSAAEVVKNGHHKEASWSCELRMPWDRYEEFMRKQLGPGYDLVSHTDSELTYRRVSNGDTYTLSAKKMSAEPLQVQLAFMARPS